MAKTRQGNEDTEGAMSRLFSGIMDLVGPALPVEERRVGGRLESSMEAGYVTDSGVSGAAQILNVSRRGMRVRTAGSLGKGTTIALNPPAEMSEHPPLMARVQWSNKEGDGYVAGLNLLAGKDDPETWLEAYLYKKSYEISGPQRRKYIRADSQMLGALQRTNKPALDVLVVNLGLGGALVRSDQVFENMTPFRLLIGPFEGLAELELSGTLLRHFQKEGERWRFYFSRFSPMDDRKDALLRKYVVKLLKAQRARQKKKGDASGAG